MLFPGWLGLVALPLAGFLQVDEIVNRDNQGNRRTETRCLAVDKARMNNTVPCGLSHRIENR
jgi:hypothetical protein